jgi:hypothetical protein
MIFRFNLPVDGHTNTVAALILHIQTKKRNMALTTLESCVKSLCIIQELYELQQQYDLEKLFLQTNLKHMDKKSSVVACFSLPP